MHAQKTVENFEPNSIVGFDGLYSFLSLSYPCPIEYNGIEYSSALHAYEASRILPEYRLGVAEILNAWEAQRWARTKPRIMSWPDHRIRVMTEINQCKFQEHPYFMKCLLSTGDAELLNEGNGYGRYWGLEHGVGENHLGRILMRLRSSWLKPAPPEPPDWFERPQ